MSHHQEEDNIELKGTIRRYDARSQRLWQQKQLWQIEWRFTGQQGQWGRDEANHVESGTTEDGTDRDAVDGRRVKKNFSLDCLKSSGASPLAANAANATRSAAGTSKASSEFSVDLSAMSGFIHEMRLGSMGMSTLFSGTDLLRESDDNEPFPDVQDILSDKRVEADKAEKFQQREYKQQELERIRIAQEVQRKLEEIEVARAGIEERGVDVEKELRRCAVAAEKEALSQVLLQLMRQKNKLSRQEQELLIRAKDLQLENRHAELQKEMRDRMAMEEITKDVEDGRVILREMLEILEKRDVLVVLLDQQELKQQREEREIEKVFQSSIR
ncbi:F-actin-monooxygenase MICAL3-like, partial [Galendromus occidentalis]|uniref:F-actin-monooxygenase MICAL3-like n=1 Tax=Galendromus occidentalis TaxID=34638 RepID=A0AAJ7WHQ5_9ACAR